MKNQLLISFLLFNMNFLFATERVELSEAVIKQLIDKGPPTVSQIQASFLEVKRQDLMAKDTFSFSLDAKAEKYKSKEKLLSSFDGSVTEQSNSYSVGLIRPTMYGATFGAKVFKGELSNSFITQASTTGASFSLSIDLYQDFLGRKSRNTVKRNTQSVRRAKLEQQIQLKSFESNIRTVYWSLVANSQRTLLLNTLVKLSEKQYKESLRRKKSGIADSGEVARYHSQWSTRKAGLLYQSYEKSMILKSLKSLIPELSEKEIVLGKYNIDSTITRVLTCSAKISSFKKPPIEYTPYDEIIDIINKEEDLNKKVIAVYDDPSLKLRGEYASVGRGFGSSQSQDDFLDNKRPRTSIGLEFSMPLGSKKTSTREVLEKLSNKRRDYSVNNQYGKILNFHYETSQMVKTLQEVVANQKDTNRYLRDSLKSTRKKYKQARISVQELISEQDAQLQSELNEIDTNLTIIKTLMDYFSVYTDFPCDLNRI